jgi:hypothetical protein
MKGIEAVRADLTAQTGDLPVVDPPSLSVEQLARQVADGCGLQIVDARQRDHMSRHLDLMAGATWRDRIVSRSGLASCREKSRSSSIAPTDSTSGAT